MASSTTKSKWRLLLCSRCSQQQQQQQQSVVSFHSTIRIIALSVCLMLAIFSTYSSMLVTTTISTTTNNNNYYDNQFTELPVVQQQLPVLSSPTATVPLSSPSIATTKDSAGNSGNMNSDNTLAHVVVARSTTTTTANANAIQPPPRMGIVSNQNIDFFRKLQYQIDIERDPYERCIEYGWKYNVSSNHPGKTKRRIFFGALIADESWELLDIISTETHNIFTGIVFVESNRTQNLTPRPFRHLQDTTALQIMFGTPLVQVRTFIHEDAKHLELEYEHAQRQEILLGWKELGMLPDDVGLLADTDEIFTRDFLRAIQSCDDIDFFTYNTDITTRNEPSRNRVGVFSGHNCQHHYTKLIGTTQVFESTPECITKDRTWHHPDMILGHCIEGIGDHHVAPRDVQWPLLRAKGFGSNCDDWEGETAIVSPPNQTTAVNLKQIPSWNAADFRRTCGGRMVARKGKNKKMDSIYTGYHFHNFFISFNQTRFKYRTYGHPDINATIKDIEKMSNDLQMMYRCVKDLPDHKLPGQQLWKRIVGGYDSLQSFRPIYFHDVDYRQRRHAHVQQMIEQDALVLQELRANYNAERDSSRIYGT